MYHYEATFALKPELDEEKRGEILEEIKNFIANEKGKIKNLDERGMRKLAYEVEKAKEGFFVTINFQTDPLRIRKIQKFLRDKEEIIRLLIVKNKKKSSDQADQKEGEENGQS